MTTPTPPAVSEAMREAVAQWLRDRFPLNGWQSTAQAIALLKSGPIASEIARLTGERDAAREDLRTSNRERNEAIETAAIAHAAHAAAEAEAEELLAGIQAVIAARDAAEAALSRLQADRDGLQAIVLADDEKALAEYEWERANNLADDNLRLATEAAELREALRGVIRVADRKTVEFDRARAALTETPDA